jgi:hypothetical protein
MKVSPLLPINVSDVPKKRIIMRNFSDDDDCFDADVVVPVASETSSDTTKSKVMHVKKVANEEKEASDAIESVDLPSFPLIKERRSIRGDNASIVLATSTVSSI